MSRATKKSADVREMENEHWERLHEEIMGPNIDFEMFWELDPKDDEWESAVFVKEKDSDDESDDDA